MPATSLNVVVSNLAVGTYQFGFTATDQKGGKSTEDFVVVTVNAAPAPTTLARVSWDGDSLLQTDGSAGQPTVPARVVTALSGASGYRTPATSSRGFENYGVSGQTLGQMLSDAQSQVFSSLNAADVSILIVEGGINDVYAAIIAGTREDTAYQNIRANLISYHSQAHAAGWRTIARTFTNAQTQSITQAQRDAMERVRVRLNQWLLAEWDATLHAYCLIDAASDYRIGLVQYPGQARYNTTYFADGIHMTPAGKDIDADLHRRAIVACVANQKAVISGQQAPDNWVVNPNATLNGVQDNSADLVLVPNGAYREVANGSQFNGNSFSGYDADRVIYGLPWTGNALRIITAQNPGDADIIGVYVDGVRVFQFTCNGTLNQHVVYETPLIAGTTSHSNFELIRESSANPAGKIYLDYVEFLTLGGGGSPPAPSTAVTFAPSALLYEEAATTYANLPASAVGSTPSGQPFAAFSKKVATPAGSYAVNTVTITIVTGPNENSGALYLDGNKVANSDFTFQSSSYTFDVVKAFAVPSGTYSKVEIRTTSASGQGYIQFMKLQ